MQKDTAFLYIGYAVIVVSFFLLHTMYGSVNTVVFINSWHTPFLDRLFASVTQLGNGLVVLPFILFFLFHRFYATLGLTLNVLIQGIIVSLFKRVLFHDAPRPINFLNTSLIHVIDGVDIHRLMSFPSGHTVTIVGLCFFLSLYFKKRVLSLFLLVVSILVGLSRIYLLQHFALDVSMGALIGVVCAAFAYHLFDTMNKPTWMQGYMEIKLRVKAPKKEPRFN